MKYFIGIVLRVWSILSLLYELLYQYRIVGMKKVLYPCCGEGMKYFVSIVNNYDVQVQLYGYKLSDIICLI